MDIASPNGCDQVITFGKSQEMIGELEFGCGSDTRGMKIYVDLPDELVAVWCPVEAIHIEADVYQITEVNSDPEDTRWAFNTGAKVRCRLTLTRDGKQTILVAYEEVPN